MIKSILKRFRNWFIAPLIPSFPEPPRATELQLLLGLQYRQMRAAGMPLPPLHEAGYSIFSEADEDGILQYIFALVGAPTRKLVDIGAATIHGSNTANLIINHGWNGLLIDGDADKIRRTATFYAENPATRNMPPKCVSSWISAENINALLVEHGFGGEIDLLSIDIDGIDYWVWKALDAARPRVVVVEYQCIWGAERSVAVPYRADFSPVYVGKYGVYNSASLPAFVKLGREKGYRLVGSQRYGYNAFFVREDLAAPVFPEATAESCVDKPFARWARETIIEDIRKLDWVEV
jgi:hypothetical protein